LDLLAPEDREKGRLVMAEIAKKGSLPGVELEMRRENGEPVPVELSAAALGDSTGAPAGAVTISRDIGDKRQSERTLRSRLMSYVLEDGNLYLVKEATPALSLEAFRDLQRAGYRGAVLSRSPPGRYQFEPGRPVDYRWMAEKGDGNALLPRLADIERWLDGFPRCRAVLVDRPDYLVSKNGFGETLHFIHRLAERAYLMGHVVLISLDPATLGECDLRALEKETREVVPRARPDLPLDELEVLRFVFEQGIAGARPTLTEIGAGLGLSKPTARKKVRYLVRLGYLTMSPRGRTKVMELTEPGRCAFPR
jgi:DNA-binding MarR family transcriptional regulator